MKLLTKIAWRNVQRHRGKSLVVGIIIFLGALIMTVGNGVIQGMNDGLRENMIERFTGHVVIVSDKQEDDNVIFSSMGIFSSEVKLIPEFFRLKDILEKQDYVSDYLPLCRGTTWILNDEGDMSFALLLGVDFEKYQKMFHNNVQILEGEFLKPDDKGILVTGARREAIYDEQFYWVKPAGSTLIKESLTEEAKKEGENLTIKDRIVIMGSGRGTLDIRSEVKGIIKYEYLNNLWNVFNIIDIESFRESFGFLTGAEAAEDIPQEKTDIIAKDNLDDLFSDSMIVQADSAKDKYNLKSILAADKSKEKTAIDSGAYNLVFVKLKNFKTLEDSVERLNADFKDNTVHARAIPWDKAVGSISGTADMIQKALYVFVILIFFVAIMIIMNTLIMTALERVSEIGMMRAVGAQKSFIGRMFVIESSILAGLFGGLGIVIGMLLILILNALNLTTDNIFLQMVFGGSRFRPAIDFLSVLIGIIELGLVTLLSILYPVRVARKITPLEAISRD